MLNTWPVVDWFRINLIACRNKPDVLGDSDLDPERLRTAFHLTGSSCHSNLPWYIWIMDRRSGENRYMIRPWSLEPLPEIAGKAISDSHPIQPHRTQPLPFQNTFWYFETALSELCIAEGGEMLGRDLGNFKPGRQRYQMYYFDMIFCAIMRSRSDSIPRDSIALSQAHWFL